MSYGRSRNDRHDVTESRRDIGESRRDIGQSCRDIGQSRRDIGQSRRDIGQSRREPAGSNYSYVDVATEGTYFPGVDRETRGYNWEASRREEYTQSRRQVSDDWDEFGATRTGENPYDHSALGATHFQHKLSETENPYSHRVLGATTPQTQFKASVNVRDSRRDESPLRVTHHGADLVVSRLGRSQHNGDMHIGNTRRDEEHGPFGEYDNAAQQGVGLGRTDVRLSRRDMVYDNANPRHSKKKKKKSTIPDSYRQGMMSTLRETDNVTDPTYKRTQDSYGWPTMALGTNWPSLFTKMRPKADTAYTPGASEVTSFSKFRSTNSSESSDTTTSTSSFLPRCTLSKRTLIALALLVGLILLVAILVPVLILAFKTPDITDDLQQYEIELKLDGVTYTSALDDKNSDEFRSLSQDFCSQIDANSASQNGYTGCTVTNFRNGSVIVVFTIVLTSSDPTLKTIDEVIVIIGLTTDDNSDTTTLGNYTVTVTTIILVNSNLIPPEQSPLPKKVAHGGSCSDTKECVSRVSKCINSICSCGVDRIYSADTDRCNKIHCGPWPSVPDADVDGDGYEYGNKINVSCKDGYVFNSNVTDDITCQTHGTWGPVHTCVPINCTRLTITNSVQDSEVYSFGSMVTVECENGYQLQGNQNVTCQADSTWTDNPTCNPVNCDQYSTSNHKYASNESTGVYMDKIDINCDDGYVYEDANITVEKCQTNKMWTDNVVCVPVVCENYTSPPNALSISGDAVSRVYGDTITLACNDGYELDDGENITIQCQSNGQWNSTDFVCSRVTCPEFIPPEFIPPARSNVTIHGYKYEDNITITCDPGYEHSKTATVVCQSDRRWSDAGTCDPITCFDFIPPENSNNPDTNGKKFGDEVNVTCKTDFVLVGSSPTTCLVNGSWPNLKCENVTCGSFGISNGHVKNATSTTLVIVCNPGYLLIGDNEVTCINKTWETGPNCTIDCGGYPEVGNGTVSATGGTTYMENVQISCNSGFKLSDGDGFATCEATGNWSRKIECIQVDCGQYNPPENGNVMIGTGKSTFETEVNVSCNTGYTLVGESSVICQQNETWSQGATCDIVNCQTPPSVANGDFSNLSSTTFNESFLVVCDAGFERVGDSEVICQSNGSWSIMPMCRPVSCDSLNAPQNGVINGTYASINGMFGDQAEISCNNGYDLLGSSFVTCQNDKTWTASPYCNIKDCGDISITNGSYNSENTTFESIATITCNEGFVLIGNQNVTCLSTGYWETIPMCEAVNCPSYPTPPNSDIVNFQVVCKEGYLLNGTADLTCRNDNTWSEVGTCYPISCDTPQNPNHGYINQSETDQFVYRDAITILCDSGYDPTPNNITCGPDGNWTANPTCTPKPCSEITVPENGNVQATTGHVFGNQVNVSCNAGYQTNGNGITVITCDENGEWDNNPTCDRRPCENFTVPDNSNIDNQSPDNRVYEDYITVTCDKGYITEGEQTTLVMCNASGQWDKSVTCEKRPCENFTVPSNGDIHGQDVDNRVYEDTINVTCNDGYLTDGEQTTVVTCAVNGQWDITVTCEKRPCEIFMVPDNSGIEGQDADNRVYGDNITVTCNDGYIIDGEQYSIFTCNASGQWDKSVTCEKRPCQIFTVPSNGDIDGQDADNRVYEDTINVTCNDGYLTDGEQTTVVTCAVNGQWDITVTCEKRPCEIFMVPDNSGIEGQDADNRVYGDNITVTCNDGYITEGEQYSIVSCNASGQWDKSVTCDKRPCEKFIVPDNSDIKGQDTDNRVYEDTINVTCNDGYLSDGEQTTVVACAVNGQWDKTVTCEKRPCENYTVPDNSDIEGQDADNRVYEDTINVTCNDGYLSDGEQTTVVTCAVNGQWDITVTCEKRPCENFIVPDNSGIEDQDANNKVYGDNITVTCNDGYITEGEQYSIVSCNASGQWDKSVTCDKRPCEKFIVPDNSDIQGQDADNRVYEDTINVTCNDGYLTDREQTTVVTCDVNGQWDKTVTCEKRPCKNYTVPDNSDIDNQRPDTHVYGDNITVTCDDGYLTEGDQSTLVTCNVSGKWEGNVACYARPCDNFSLPLNGNISSVSSSGHVYGDKVTVQCNGGYNLIGDADVACQTDGSWGELPVCVKCETVIVKNGSVQYSGLNGSVTCDTGFLLNGSNVVICDSTGKWSEFPECNPVDCGNPAFPDNGVVILTNNATTFESTATVNCDLGYTLTGSQVIQCFDNETWSGNYSCGLVNCNQYLPSTNTVILDVDAPTTYNSTILVTCISGYELNDSSIDSVTCGADGLWSGNPECERVVCEEFNISGSRSVISSSMYRYGDVVTVECSLGFNLSGNPNITCGVNGNWSDLPTCEMITCMRFETTDQSSIASIEPDQNVYTFNESVTITCETGYTLNDTNDVKCTNDGIWNIVPACEPVDCGTFVTPANGSYEGNSTLYGAVVHITCNSGYLTNGSNSSQCQSMGNWSETGFCQPVDCDMYPKPSNGIISYDGQSTLYESVVTISCNTGYQLDGLNSSACLDTGDWSETGTCVPLDCGTFEPPAHASAVNPGNTTIYNSTISFDCDNGYDFKNENITTVVCDESGEWYGNPECIPVSCGTFSLPDNATSPNSTNEEFTFGDVLNVDCLEGFIRVGSNIVECLENATWSSHPLCKQHKCPDIELPNAVIEYKSVENATITCNDRYTLNGDPVIYCLTNNTWTEQPQCDLSACEMFPLSSNMNISTSNDSIGVEVIVQCDEGYNLTGNNAVICNQDGNWSDLTLVCEQIDCGTPDNPEHGTANLTDFVTTVNATAEIKCNDGYNLSGSAIMQCLSNGSWNIEGYCEIVDCKQYVPLTNTTIINVNAPTTFNSSISVTCSMGYQLKDLENSTVTCGADGNWNGSPECVEVVCNIFNLTDNLTILNDSADEYTYGETVVVECIKGFNMSGNALITCDANGTWTEFPTCRLITCDSIDKTANMSISPEESVYNYNDSVSITCDSGYELNDTSNVRCTETGQWSAVPSCVPISCGDYVPPDNGNYEGNSTSFGAAVSLKCNVGYQLIGMNISQCVETGNWSVGGNCELVECDPFNVSDHEFILNSTDSSDVYTVGDVLVVDCIEGFIRIGSRNVECTANGTWTALPACAIHNCSNVEIPNAQINHTASDNATIECDDNYSLNGPSIIYCQDNNSWTEIPTCNLTGCGPLPFSDKISTNTTDDDIGVVVYLECDNGYNLNGSSTVTCTEFGTWSEHVACLIVDCGMYGANDMTTFSIDDGNTTFNTTIQATCKPGLAPVDGADMSLICDETGNWTGSPECEIKGSVAFEEPFYVFEIGSSNRLTCKIQNSPDWRNIQLFKVQTTGPEIIVSLNNINGTLSNTTTADYHVTADITGNDVSLHLIVDNVTCQDEGMYVCGLIVGDLDSPIAIKEANASVALTANATVPTITIPDAVYGGRDVEIKCNGNVGRTADGAFGKMVLQYSNGSDPFETLIEVNDTDCDGTVTLTYQHLFQSNATLRCGSELPSGDVLYSEEKNITVSFSYVAFGYPTYAFNIGETANLTCDAANLPGWQEILISRSTDAPLVRIFDGNSSIVGDGITISGESEFQAFYARVILFFDSVACDVIGDVVYTCAVRVNTTWTNSTATIKFQKQPEVPILTLSREIINNKWTLDDRGFICEAQLGNPPGYMEIESDITGTWETFLTPDEAGKNNSVGFIYKNSSLSSNCSNTQALYFAFHKVTMDWQLRQFRCVVKPSDELLDGRTLLSDEGVIKILDDDFCVGNPAGRYLHPYHCHLAVVCSDGGVLEGVPEPCSIDECATTSGCSVCGACNVTEPEVKYVRCSTSSEKSGSEGSEVVFQCELDNRVTEITSISISKDKMEIFSENNPTSPVRINDLNANVNVDIDSRMLTFTFESVLCENEGVYAIQVNNKSGDAVTLNVMGHSDKPILSEMSTPVQDQEMVVTCQGKVAELDAEPAYDFRLQAKFANDTEYLDDSSIPVYSHNCSDCICDVTAVFSILTDASWNNSNIRCATSNETHELVSAGQDVILTKGAIRFIEGDETLQFNHSLQIQCELSENIWSSGVKISRSYNSSAEQDVCSFDSVGIGSCSLQGFSANSTQINNTLVVMVYKENIACEDAGKYFCFAVSDSESRTSKNIDIIRLAVEPELTMSPMIVQDVGTWGDRAFFCEAKFGNQDAELLVESDFNGQFELFLSAANSDNDIGFIVDGYPQNTETTCNTYQSIKFALKNVTLEYHEKRLRCVTKSTSATFGNVTLYSEEGEIKVVEKMFCNDKEGAEAHPYFCDLKVNCNTDNGIASIESCPAGKCFNKIEKTCQDCSLVNCSDYEETPPAEKQYEHIICAQSTLGGIAGAAAVVDCGLVNVTQILSLNLTKDGQMVFTGVGDHPYDGMVNIDGHNIELNINITGESLAITFTNISCGDEGVYTISLNNGTNDQLTLVVTSEPTEPDISVQNSNTLGEEIVVSCTANVGRTIEQLPMGTTALEVKLQNEQVFSAYQPIMLNQDACNDCACVDNINVTITADLSWNNSEVRCVTKNTTSTFTVSPASTVVLYERGVECINATGYKGDIVILHCSLTGIAVNVSTLAIEPITISSTTGINAVVTSHSGQPEPVSGSLSIGVSTNSIDLVFSPLDCDHDAIYTVEYNTLKGEASIATKVNATTPTISTLPDKFYQDQEVTFTCEADVGRPPRTLYLLQKVAGASNYSILQGNEASTESTDNCSAVMSVTYSVIVDEDMQGDLYMCSAMTDTEPALDSEQLTVDVEPPAIYFKDHNVTAAVGTSVSFDCVVGSEFAASGAIISRTTDDGKNSTELCPSGMCLDGYSTSSATSQNDSSLTVTITIDPVSCEDNGQFVCASAQDPLIQSSMEFIASKNASSPILEFPTALIIGKTTGQDALSCSADLGYPPGRIQLEYYDSNDQTYVMFTHSTNSTMPDGNTNCSESTKTITFNQIIFTADVNNTDFRCSVYESETSDVVSVASTPITLLLLDDIYCDKGDGYYNHPYNCHNYIQCSNGITYINPCAGSLCPVIANGTLTQCDHCTDEQC